MLKGSLEQFIPCGRENAITAKRLAELAGCGRRDVFKEIARLRRDEQKLICGDGNGLFYGNLKDISRSYERALKRARRSLAAFKWMREATRLAEGQQDFFDELEGGNSAE